MRVPLSGRQGTELARTVDSAPFQGGARPDPMAGLPMPGVASPPDCLVPGCYRIRGGVQGGPVEGTSLGSESPVLSYWLHFKKLTRGYKAPTDSGTKPACAS